MLKRWWPILAIVVLSACGGGGGGDAPVPPAGPPSQKVGEIFSTPAELSTAELRTTFGYAGNVATSRAIQQSGRANILDLLFVTHGGDRAAGVLPTDLDGRLSAYVAANADLLVPGVRVLVADEVFWNPPDNRDDASLLDAQHEALRTAIAKVRAAIPGASVGITVTPYATFERPNTVAAIRRAICLVDWVGTDVYWLGDAGRIADLHRWSAGFPALARAANARVEVWYIAQAFRLAEWDLATFRDFIREELVNAAGYDGVLFFGWQFASEITSAIIGRNFDPQTRALYGGFLTQ